MKIGIDAREFRRERMTGIGRYLRLFLEQAVAGDDGHRYVLFCNQETDIPLDHPRLKKVTAVEKMTWLWDQVQLPLRMKKERIDVFLTPYFKAPLAAPSPVVLIINDLIPLFFPEEHGWLSRTYFRLMSGIATRRADRIVAISMKTKEDLLKFFRLPAPRISVVHLGLEERFRRQESSPAEITKKYGLPQQYILYVGNLSPHKNVKGLVQAYSLLPESLRKRHKLVLVSGQADQFRPGIEKKVKKTGMSADVVFAGCLDDKDLPAVYRSAFLFVFPSFYEGFGLPPLEAMACGCPVASSNASSMPEVLGEAALFFDPDDRPGMAGAMRRLAEDENLRTELQRKGRARADVFSARRMYGQFMSILESAGQKERPER